MPRMNNDAPAPWGMGDQVFSSLLRHRIVFLGQAVDDEIANRITAQLLMLAAQSEEDIYLYINSPGGSVTAGMAVYDTMQIIKNDVVTIAMGFCASMGQFLLTSGAPGKRFALPHAKILMHQPSAGFSGSASDIRIYVQHLLKTKREMAELIARHSGNDVERITKDSDRDYWFSAQEAKEYGLIDDVIQSTPAISGGGGLAAR
ncbi:ATP-dependent Clp protease proteolytic subunit [Streptomyces sp. NPDC088915]|uniref:ATP-dependent Clp protease proteolytic subunit n=1 Tax=Streptomyces sp. NPDC088915 TaxID=3365912 RepID=UPI0037FF7DEA